MASPGTGATASTTSPAAAGDATIDTTADADAVDDVAGAADAEDDVDVPTETMDGEAIPTAKRTAAAAATKADKFAERAARGLPALPGAITGEPVKDAPYIFVPHDSDIITRLRYVRRRGGGGGDVWRPRLDALYRRAARRTI